MGWLSEESRFERAQLRDARSTAEHLSMTMRLFSYACLAVSWSAVALVAYGLVAGNAGLSFWAAIVALNGVALYYGCCGDFRRARVLEGGVDAQLRILDSRMTGTRVGLARVHAYKVEVLGTEPPQRRVVRCIPRRLLDDGSTVGARIGRRWPRRIEILS